MKVELKIKFLQDEDILRFFFLLVIWCIGYAYFYFSVSTRYQNLEWGQRNEACSSSDLYL